MPPPIRKIPTEVQPESVRMLTINIGGPVRQVPDMLTELTEFIVWNGASHLGNHWSFMRSVETMFARERRIRIIEGWVKMDDGDLAYYVRASRTTANSAVSKYEVIGAADMAEVSVTPVTP